MKKILSLLFSVMLVASIIAVPVMAEETESEFTPEFIGIGSAGVAYDDLTLPQATANGDAITWSTTTTDVIEIVDNTTAKIIKYVEDAQLDANVVATVGDKENIIAFRVGYAYGVTTNKFTQDFSDVTLSSSRPTNTNNDKFWYKASVSTDTMSIVDGMWVLSRPTTSGTDLSALYTFGGTGFSSGTHVFSFDISYESTMGGIYTRIFPNASTTISPIHLDFSSGGYMSSRNDDTKIKLNLMSQVDDVSVYGGNVKIVLNYDYGTFKLFYDGNLVLSDMSLIDTGTQTPKGNLRICASDSTAKGNIWIDNIISKTFVNPYAGLEQSTINPVEEGGDATIASSLTLPATNTATYPVTWTSADSSFAIDGATATDNASYFGTKAGSLTATATNGGVSYVKNYSFTIPAAEFPATTTAVVTGDKAAGGTLTATISGLTSTSDILTAIIGVYNGNELVAIKLAPQAVTDGKLTVTTDALGSDVSAESDVKVFVLDSANTANPLTKVTVQ